MLIYLIGYMGSGKTTLGQVLAKAMSLPWIDMDDEFVKRHDMSISQHFHQFGEPSFRNFEHQLLVEISTIKHAVVSTGGGNPCFHGNMDIMKQSGITVYLQTAPEVLLQRIELSESKRPLIAGIKDGNTLQRLTQHLQSRESYYASAQIKVDSSQTDIPSLITLIHLAAQKFS